MNPNTHLYLYFKGWYEKTETESDLKKIISATAGISEAYITHDAIIDILVSAAVEVALAFSSPSLIVATLIKDSAKEDVIPACGNILRLALLKEFKIGKPDSTILPISDSGLELIDAMEWAK